MRPSILVQFSIVRFAGLSAVVVGGLTLLTGCPDLFPPMDDGEPAPTTGNSGLTGKFAGSQRCEQCHSHTHLHWSETLHAKALETLEAIGQDKNPDCVRCHVVGFGQSGGFVDRATTNDLAGVGCESCHGPARDHADNVNEEALRPPLNLAASVCGECHQGAHHPNFDEWADSGHASVNESVSEDLIEGGTFVNACGQCHSGTVFWKTAIERQPVAEDEFAGLEPADLIGVSCAVCHDPHLRTGNATDPGDGRDFQLRFPETAQPFPTNTVAAATDPTRFNICGQCHHSRGRDWTSTSRGPHQSIQSNVYIGEMPAPDANEDGVTEPLVASMVHKHIEAPEQCATCHMYRQDFMSDRAPAIAGHTFQVSFAGCMVAGCHNPGIETRTATFQSNVQTRLDGIAMRLGDASTWEYSATGGPMDQDGVSDNIKKIRFLLRYIEADGSLGVHNPDYVTAMLSEAERLLVVEGR